MSVEAGMQTLLARRAAEIKAGAEPVGWKIGINVPAVQEHLGIDGPVVGYLTSDGVLAPGASVSIEGWTAPALEPEVAIRIGDDGEVAALSPALELVDVDLPLDAIEPILAGNVFHRAVCFGSESAPEALAGAVCRLTIDGEEVRATDELIDSVGIVAYVRDFLATHGAVLAPGDRIIAGSLTPPFAPLTPGQRGELDLGGLGSVALAFE